MAETLAERARRWAALRAENERKNPGALGARLRDQAPLRLQWRLKSPGLIVPISDSERVRCGMSTESKLTAKIRDRIVDRSVRMDEEARAAWENVSAPRRSAGKLALPIPVKWQGDPEPDDDIPF